MDFTRLPGGIDVSPGFNDQRAVENLRERSEGRLVWLWGTTFDRVMIEGPGLRVRTLILLEAALGTLEGFGECWVRELQLFRT